MFLTLFKWSDVEVLCFRAVGREIKAASCRGAGVNSPSGLDLIEVLCHHCSNTSGWMLLKCINISSLIGSLQSNLFSPSLATSIQTHIYISKYNCAHLQVCVVFYLATPTWRSLVEQKKKIIQKIIGCVYIPPLPFPRNAMEYVTTLIISI